MAHATRRPILVQCNKLPNGGFKTLLTSASTLSEFRRDIIQNTPLTNTELTKFMFVLNGEQLTESSVIPLFNSCAGVTNPADPKVQVLINKFRTDPTAEEFLAISMAETAKNTASGSSIAESCKFLEENGIVDEFVAEFGIEPELASAKTLDAYVSKVISGKIKKSSASTSVATKTPTDQVEQLKAENARLKQRIANLEGYIAGFKAGNDDDDDDDDWNDDAASDAEEIQVDMSKLIKR